VRPDKETRGKLFAIYDNEDAVEILSLKVAKNSKLYYLDPADIERDGPEAKAQAVNLNINLVDGK
jgi:hypothetical protein